MAVWKLSYQDPYSQKPFLRFVAFGQADLALVVEEWSGTLSSDLRLQVLDAQLFRSGADWDSMLIQQPELAQQVSAASTALVIEGEVELHESLDYLRETLELLGFLVGHGAVAVYDAMALTWLSADDWEELMTQGGIFNPFDHVSLLVSPQDDGATWLRTRGMRKFGRPDLSARGVEAEEVPAVQKVIDRFINFQALGGVMEAGRAVEMVGLDSIYRPGSPEGGLQDPDFLNFRVELRKDSRA